MAVKHIFVTGGVVSGLGKGLTAASLGRLLKARGLKVRIQKFDPYLNVDPGTMSPLQHGEVFVTDDGCECDLDLGHYERFIDENLNAHSAVTAGMVYWEVLSNERKGEYLGRTVQVIPHITDEIKDRVRRVGRGTDVVITEIGGTVGDMESQPFMEAIRQISFDVGRVNCLFIHVTLLPFISSSLELKSKPTQHSVKSLLSLGIQPDIIVCRTEHIIDPETRRKIALFCNVGRECVIQNYTAPSLYELPLMLEEEGLAKVVCKKLRLTKAEPDLAEWRELVARIKSCTDHVKIALVGKYNSMPDAYLSVTESLNHAGIAANAKVDVKWIDAEELTDKNADELLGDVHGILVPGGFGERGIEGKISAVRYAREKDIPYFGICLGMQMAVIEYARNVLGMKDAHSSEFSPKTKNPVISIMAEQKKVTEKGGTMRLGQYPCKVQAGSKAYDAYKSDMIFERHRHRYEFNNEYRDRYLKNKMALSGLSPDGWYVEIIEIPEKRWFVGVQFHPEFKSRPNRPHPLFREFVKAAVEHKKDR